MAYEPANTLSYCEVDGRLVFLDIADDRYFCLQADAEDAFRTTLAHGSARHEVEAPQTGPDGDPYVGPNTGPDTGIADRLDLLATAIAAREPRHCDAGCIPTASLLDGPPRPASIIAVLSALVHLAWVRRRLRRGGFAKLIAALRAAKARAAATPPAQRVRIERLALDFERTARLTRSHDQCLARAITLARMALSRGMVVDLVIGVQLRPFAAHAWVRSGSTLLNEHVDAARIYTPILVV